jgi:hypothetical protein
MTQHNIGNETAPSRFAKHTALLNNNNGYKTEAVNRNKTPVLVSAGRNPNLAKSNQKLNNSL